MDQEDEPLLKQANQLLSAGQARGSQGDATGALQLYEQARACGRHIKNVRLAKNVECVAVSSLGSTYFSLGQHERAVEHLRQSLAIDREIGDRPGEGSDLGNLGNAYNSLGQHECAIEHLTQALAILREIGDRRNEGAALGGLGIAYDNLQQHERAVDHHTQALAISREIGDRQGEVNHLGNLGSAYEGLRQHEHGIENRTQALAISREIGDRQSEVMCLGHLGNAYNRLGQNKRAVELHTQALAISRKSGNRNTEGTDLRNLGTAYDDLGQHEHAIELHTQALAISREIGARETEGSCLGSLGSAYYRMGQHERAIEHHMQGLAIGREVGDREGEGNSLARLGNAYEGLRQHERAIDHYTQGLAISREVGNRRTEGNALGGLGNAYDHLGQFDRAIEHLTQALAISREVGDRQSEGNWLGSLGVAYYRLRQHERAIEHHTQGLAVSREVGDRLGEAVRLNNIGFAHLDGLNDPAAALPWLQQARSTHEDLWDALATDERRVSYGDTFSQVARGLQRAHARLDQPAAALEAAEHARSRAFELLLAQQRLARGVALPAALATGDAAAPQGSDALLEVAARQGVTIVIFSQLYKSELLAWVVRGGTPLAMKQIDIPASEKSITQLTELTRRTIGARARQGQATARSAAEQINPSALAPPTVDEAALGEELAARGILMLDDDDDATTAAPTPARPADPVTELLRRCHELLIAPLSLVDGEPLLLVPDRDLYALPFSALVDADGRHLIECHTLRVVPSVGTAVELEKRAAGRDRPIKPSALVVGDPTFGAEPSWALPLPSARVEARRVAFQLEEHGYADNVERKVGDAATKAAVVAEMVSSDIVHLATHGEPDGVLLGGPTKAEGKLSMGEVQSLELRARLVVLSECDSFRGKLSSDGVIGITRAFVAAGAPTLVASLWKVDDVATRELMERFYARLLAGGAMGDATAAMQGAMVSMIRDERRGWSVLEWAAFVVYGL